MQQYAGVRTDRLYIGALDNEIHVYDMCRNVQVNTLIGNTETPMSLALSPNG
ncbi:hypothetical protein JOM56_014170 [Amanita muscaria]